MRGGGSGLTLAEAERLVFDHTSGTSGRYYGPADSDLALGVGLIYANVRIPVYDVTDGLFSTQTATVVVLTHECDIEQGNAKIFNNDVLIAPLAPFEVFFEKMAAERPSHEIRAYLGDLAAGRISQLMYLPHLTGHLPNGAIVYLNRIAHTHFAEFGRKGAKRIGALTGYGLRQLDARLTSHLLREKADALPLTR
jgi:hypothetical protein